MLSFASRLTPSPRSLSSPGAGHCCLSTSTVTSLLLKPVLVTTTSSPSSLTLFLTPLPSSHSIQPPCLALVSTILTSVAAGLTPAAGATEAAVGVASAPCSPRGGRRDSGRQGEQHTWWRRRLAGVGQGAARRYNMKQTLIMKRRRAARLPILV
ncbi:hypothetical protein E2C01_026937 [Portunus trituberculatus]|uniref:Uncharacterized protein n=1 Tax=Portunus trituberculatus TaxID=210409 RepID=A0A5B7EHF5_PORTR|nr:hypothetical protein [Portunus trituberculatus]